METNPLWRDGRIPAPDRDAGPAWHAFDHVDQTIELQAARRDPALSRHSPLQSLDHPRQRS